MKDDELVKLNPMDNTINPAELKEEIEEVIKLVKDTAEKQG